ncbi:MAG: toll/interleukin-1 receptor domain-containing protein [Candidatus Brocadiia bacterium]
MNVFVSYSVNDVEVVRKFVEQLRAIGVTVYWWDDCKELGKRPDSQIKEWIRASSVVLVIVTDSSVKKALTVGMEVGWADEQGKMIIPFVHKSIPRDQLGFLGSMADERFDESSIDRALEACRTNIEREILVATNIAEEKAQRDGLKTLGIICVIVGLLLLFFASNE